MRFLFRVQSFVTGTLSDARLCCDNKSVVASRHEVPAEWKRTPNSTQTSDCGVLAEIWATRDLLPVTARPAVLHIKGHQDKKTACEQLPLPAQLNVDAHKLAGDCMTNHPNTDHLLEETKHHGASERPGKSLRTKSTRTNASSDTE